MLCYHSRDISPFHMTKTTTVSIAPSLQLYPFPPSVAFPRDTVFFYQHLSDLAPLCPSALRVGSFDSLYLPPVFTGNILVAVCNSMSISPRSPQPHAGHDLIFFFSYGAPFSPTLAHCLYGTDVHVIDYVSTVCKVAQAVFTV